MEKVEKSKPLSKNKSENTSIDTVLKNGGIAFSFISPPNPTHYFTEKIETLYFSMNMQILKIKKIIFISKNKATTIGKGQ